MCTANNHMHEHDRHYIYKLQNIPTRFLNNYIAHVQFNNYKISCVINLDSRMHPPVEPHIDPKTLKYSGESLI